MALLNGTESIEQVEQVVCDFFGTTLSKVRSKEKRSAVAYARHFLIYILNTHYSVSWQHLLIRYQRCVRTIARSVSLMKYYIEHDKQYKQYYYQLWGS